MTEKKRHLTAICYPVIWFQLTLNASAANFSRLVPSTSLSFRETALWKGALDLQSLGHDGKIWSNRCRHHKINPRAKLTHPNDTPSILSHSHTHTPAMRASTQRLCIAKMNHSVVVSKRHRHRVHLLGLKWCRPQAPFTSTKTTQVIIYHHHSTLFFQLFNLSSPGWDLNRWPRDVSLQANHK